MGKSVTAWRDDIMEACAKAEVLDSIRAWHQPSLLRPYFGDAILPTPCQIAVAGGEKGIYHRIRQGLNLEDKLRPWTGDFIKGLRISRCFNLYNYHFVYLVQDRHTELYQDIQNMHLPISWKIYHKEWGDYLRISRFPAAHLPPESLEGDGPEVIAGLLAGGTYWSDPVLSLADYYEWIHLPNTSEILDLLDQWSIVWIPSQKIRGRSCVAVSPFYAALFASRMPGSCAERALRYHKPANSPFLAVVYWDAAFGTTAGARMLPYKDALPYGCSLRTIRRRDWKRKDLHEKAIALGITHVSDNLREIMEEWVHEHWEEAGKRL